MSAVKRLAILHPSGSSDNNNNISITTPAEIWHLLAKYCPHDFWLCGVNKFIHHVTCVPTRKYLSKYQLSLESYLIFRLCETQPKDIERDLGVSYWAPSFVDAPKNELADWPRRPHRLKRALYHGPHIAACHIGRILRCITAYSTPAQIQSYIVVALRGLLTASTWNVVSARFNTSFILQMCREAFGKRDDLKHINADLRIIREPGRDGITHPIHGNPMLFFDFKATVKALLTLPSILAPRFSDNRTGKMSEVMQTVERFASILYRREIYEPSADKKYMVMMPLNENYFWLDKANYTHLPNAYNIVTTELITAVIHRQISRELAHRIYRRFLDHSTRLRLQVHETRPPVDIALQKVPQLELNMYILCLLLENDQKEWDRVFNALVIPRQVYQWHQRFRNTKEFVESEFANNSPLEGHVLALSTLYNDGDKALRFVQLSLNKICEATAATEPWMVDTLWKFIELHYANTAIDWGPVSKGLNNLYFISAEAKAKYQFNSRVLLHLTVNLARAETLHLIVDNLINLQPESFILHRSNKKTSDWLTGRALARFIGEFCNNGGDSTSIPPWMTAWCDLICRLPKTRDVVAAIIKRRTTIHKDGRVCVNLVPPERRSTKSYSSKTPALLYTFIWTQFSRAITQQEAREDDIEKMAVE